MEINFQESVVHMWTLQLWRQFLQHLHREGDSDTAWNIPRSEKNYRSEDRLKLRKLPAKNLIDFKFVVEMLLMKSINKFELQNN